SEFVAFLGLKSKEELSLVIGKDGIDLSEGQKQKLCFLRAVLTNPQVLILDEVFTSLDQKDINYMFALCEKIPFVFVVSRKPEVMKFVTKHLFINGGLIEALNL
ncbi:MAG: ATP-binding cassette domain-containing protein, partial [Salinivirgaceae bacterium]|nr:ATP-binding cassette domain-containing protein [Salinivirgaceae bacterium]